MMLSERLIFTKFSANRETFVKIGMELYYSAGQDLVKAILEQGHDVF